jgi:hypothetical protein
MKTLLNLEKRPLNRLCSQFKVKCNFLLIGLTAVILISPSLVIADTNLKYSHLLNKGINSDTDRVQILQKCIDFPGLESFLKKGENNKYQKLYVVRYLIEFPKEIITKKYGQAVDVLGRDEIYAQGINAFFIFKELKIKVDSATVLYEYNYDAHNGKAIEITLELQKNQEEWSIVNFKQKSR